MSTKDSTRSAATSYARTFLRFLRWSDLNDQDLARFVPRTPCWRLAHLPPRLPWEDVRRAIDAIDRTTVKGRRDRAILLLLATTGIRNKELRSLELEDIRWRAAEILVRQGKARRDRVAYVHETDRHFHQSGHLRINHSRHFARATAGPPPRGGARRWRLT